MKRSLLIPSLFALSVSGALAASAAAATEPAPLQLIAVQDGGRVKPLDTFARELAKRVQGAKPFGFERVAGLEPVEWLLASLASPERWQAEAIVKVTHAGLRQAAGLPAGRDRFSLKELAEHEGLRSAAAAVRAKLDRDLELDPVDREVLELENTLAVYQGVTTGESLRVVPHPDDPKAAWFSIADLRSEEAADIPQLGRLRALSGAMLLAYRSGDQSGVAIAARAFSARLGRARPHGLPRRQGPADGGPLQHPEAVPHGVAALPRRLAGAARELPARLAQAGAAGLRRARGRLPAQQLRHGAAHPDLGPPAGHQHVRDASSSWPGAACCSRSCSRPSTRRTCSRRAREGSGRSRSSSPTACRSSTPPSRRSCRCCATTCGSPSTCSRSCWATRRSRWRWASDT